MSFHAPPPVEMRGEPGERWRQRRSTEARHVSRDPRRAHARHESALTSACPFCHSEQYQAPHRGLHCAKISVLSGTRLDLSSRYTGTCLHATKSDSNACLIIARHLRRSSVAAGRRSSTGPLVAAVHSLAMLTGTSQHDRCAAPTCLSITHASPIRLVGIVPCLKRPSFSCMREL